MFTWYQDAESCYVYLSDVCFDSDDVTMDGSDPEWLKSFQSSKWFTRGWTLQELLAPGTVVFFDKNWMEFGTKESLEDQVISITGIRHLFNIEAASIAQKFSWASKRETTRIEDTAYCLMGIFGVNMPLLYVSSLHPSIHTLGYVLCAQKVIGKPRETELHVILSMELTPARAKGRRHF